MKMALLLLALLLSIAALPVGADTGTYIIEQYDVALTPHADGKVDLDYHQRWRVTGGHIPWITVGVPNADFVITKSGLAVRRIASANEGGWSGIRLDLDRDYQPGQTFDVSFSIKQNRLFYADAKNYRLDFWPGWYDNAPVQALTLRVKFFVKLETVTADPPPTTRTADEFIWSGIRLDKGERYKISIAFPKTTLPQAIPPGQLREAEGEGEGEEYPGAPTGGASFWVILIVFGVIALLLLYFFAWIGQHARYTGGGIWYGGSGDRGGGGGRSRRIPGGGGGFGGGGFSCACACACVSCACACACAGGGGAGCSRKAQHQCPQCEEAKDA